MTAPANARLLDVMTSGNFVVTGPTAGNESVEAWSIKRLPFEPKGWVKDLRAALRSELKVLTWSTGNVLHARFVSNDTRAFDVENVLLYNVGNGYFANTSQTGLRLERAFAHPPAPPLDLRGETLHYHQYRLAGLDSTFHHWKAGKRLAKWAAPLPSASQMTASSVWLTMKRGQAEVEKSTSDDVTALMIRATVGVPPGVRTNAAGLIKPLFDGILASFHAHDGSEVAKVSARLSEALDADSGEIEELLLDRDREVLGLRRLLWPWGDTVQWNPADDRIVAAELLVAAAEPGRSLQVEGELFEAAPA